MDIDIVVDARGMRASVALFFSQVFKICARVFSSGTGYSLQAFLNFSGRTYNSAATMVGLLQSSDLAIEFILAASAMVFILRKTSRSFPSPSTERAHSCDDRNISETVIRQIVTAVEQCHAREIQKARAQDQNSLNLVFRSINKLTAVVEAESTKNSQHNVLQCNKFQSLENRISHLIEEIEELTEMASRAVMRENKLEAKCDSIYREVRDLKVGSEFKSVKTMDLLVEQGQAIQKMVERNVHCAAVQETTLQTLQSLLRQVVDNQGIVERVQQDVVDWSVKSQRQLAELQDQLSAICIGGDALPETFVESLNKSFHQLGSRVDSSFAAVQSDLEFVKKTVEGLKIRRPPSKSLNTPPQSPPSSVASHGTTPKPPPKHTRIVNCRSSAVHSSVGLLASLPKIPNDFFKGFGPSVFPTPSTLFTAQICEKEPTLPHSPSSSIEVSLSKKSNPRRRRLGAHAIKGTNSASNKRGSSGTTVRSTLAPSTRITTEALSAAAPQSTPTMAKGTSFVTVAAASPTEVSPLESPRPEEDTVQATPSDVVTAPALADASLILESSITLLVEAPSMTGSSTWDATCNGVRSSEDWTALPFSSMSPLVATTDSTYVETVVELCPEGIAALQTPAIANASSTPQVEQEEAPPIIEPIQCAPTNSLPIDTFMTHHAGVSNLQALSSTLPPVAPDLFLGVVALPSHAGQWSLRNQTKTASGPCFSSLAALPPVPTSLFDGFARTTTTSTVFSLPTPTPAVLAIPSVMSSIIDERGNTDSCVPKVDPSVSTMLKEQQASSFILPSLLVVSSEPVDSMHDVSPGFPRLPGDGRAESGRVAPGDGSTAAPPLCSSKTIGQSVPRANQPEDIQMGFASALEVPLSNPDDMEIYPASMSPTSNAPYGHSKEVDCPVDLMETISTDESPLVDVEMDVKPRETKTGATSSSSPQFELDQANIDRTVDTATQEQLSVVSPSSPSHAPTLLTAAVGFSSVPATLLGDNMSFQLSSATPSSILRGPHYPIEWSVPSDATDHSIPATSTASVVPVMDDSRTCTFDFSLPRFLPGNAPDTSVAPVKPPSRKSIFARKCNIRSRMEISNRVPALAGKVTEGVSGASLSLLTSEKGPSPSVVQVGDSAPAHVSDASHLHLGTKENTLQPVECEQAPAGPAAAIVPALSPVAPKSAVLPQNDWQDLLVVPRYADATRPNRQTSTASPPASFPARSSSAQTTGESSTGWEDLLIAPRYAGARPSGQTVAKTRGSSGTVQPSPATRDSVEATSAQSGPTKEEGAGVEMLRETISGLLRRIVTVEHMERAREILSGGPVSPADRRRGDRYFVNKATQSALERCQTYIGKLKKGAVYNA
ncbi:hypothetical protein HDU93_000879 [Gonapodya sp. JEL0774]|nr:hypothetical protein HDU93_000879 [Gonapodya sp. JEL0774]